MKLRIAIAAALVLLVATPALPQALVNLSSVRVTYMTRKNTAKPEGEPKAQLDALEAQIAEATRLGQSGEIRRLYAKGMTLLAGRPWPAATLGDEAVGVVIPDTAAPGLHVWSVTAWNDQNGTSCERPTVGATARDVAEVRIRPW